MTTLDALLADPEWFPETLDTSGDMIRFARVTAAGLRATPFLDQRMAPIVTDRREAPLSQAVKTWRSDKARKTHTPAFIFHSAFCCSTLLARALDAPGTCLALKEPDILMALANALRVDETLKRDARAANQIVDFIFELLGRRFTGGERILLKPTNSANNLLPHALRLKAPSLALYGDLRSFLVSVIKKGEPCKAFVRLQYNIFSLDPGGLSAIPHRQAMGLTDLQVAAMIWRHQLELFTRELEQSRGNNPVSLDFRALLESPAECLAAVSRHLKLRHLPADLTQIANGPVFRQNSKDAQEEYDSARRDAEEAELDARHGETLDLIVPWAMGLNLGQAFDLPLPRPLTVASAG
tara:strand:- start:261 stop:1319 length:1059 start_codon:yes stop_codon:yes gene_type:complete